MAFVHARDFKRPQGGYVLDRDGNFVDPYSRTPGYLRQLIQYPVICAADVIDYTPSQGSHAPVTTETREVTCPDCRERVRGGI